MIVYVDHAGHVRNGASDIEKWLSSSYAQRLHLIRGQKQLRLIVNFNNNRLSELMNISRKSILM